MTSDLLYEMFLFGNILNISYETMCRMKRNSDLFKTVKQEILLATLTLLVDLWSSLGMPNSVMKLSHFFLIFFS